MSEFNYTFQYNSTDGLITLDFLNKKIHVFEDPWGRDSSSSPDYVIAFNDVMGDNVLTSRFKTVLHPDVIHEIQFLTEQYSIETEFPKGDRLFYFKSSFGYFKQKEKSNLIIGFVFLLIAIFALFQIFNSYAISSQQGIETHGTKNIGIYILISIMGLAFFITLLGLYIKRVRVKGFNVLGTQYGIYVYRNNKIENYLWNSFTGKHEIIREEKGFIYELKEFKSVYNKYGSNKTNKHLNFVGINDYEFYLKIFNHRISDKTP